MSKLYQAGKIGTLEIRNRMVMTAMHLSYCPTGEVEEQMIGFYRARARGGVGLIIVGGMGLDPLRVNQKGMVQIHEDRFIEGLKKLTTAVHEEGAKIFPQLFHAGRYARSAEYGGLQPVSASAIASRFTGEMPQALTEQEIKDIVMFFAKAAKRAQLAGFDGVEVTGNSGYLIAQFLSPITNQRTDRYGGDLEGRLTFPLEVVQGIRAEVGADFPIMFRLGGNDFIPGGNTQEEARAICRSLEKAGVDAIDVTGGWHESRVPQITMDVPGGGFRYLGKNIKSAVSIPVLMCNRWNPRLAEDLIDSGDADFVGLARANIADPEVSNKAMQGDYEGIRPCVGCNQGCLDNVLFGKTLSCLVNAEVGREWELVDGGLRNTQTKSCHPQKILVVGAGVAGLEYARVAATLGHQVTIWEEKAAPGGQTVAASIPPGRQDYRRLIDYLQCAVQRLKVEVVYGKKASLENIKTSVQAKLYERIVVATGAIPGAPSIDIFDGVQVLQATEVLEKRLTTGAKVVILGAGGVGIETALFLAESGTLSAQMLRFLMIHQAETPETLYRLITQGNKEVTVVDLEKGKGKDLGPTTRSVLLSMANKYGVNILEKTKAIQVGLQGVLIENSEGERWLSADTVIFAEKSLANNDLYTELVGTVESLDKIGDAVKPGNMQSAIQQAYQAARAI